MARIYIFFPHKHKFKFKTKKINVWIEIIGEFLVICTKKIWNLTIILIKWMCKPSAHGNGAMATDWGWHTRDRNNVEDWTWSCAYRRNRHREADNNNVVCIHYLNIQTISFYLLSKTNTHTHREKKRMNQPATEEENCKNKSNWSSVP